MKNLTLLFSFTLFIVFIAGCAKPPEQELQIAKAALDSALAVHADKYVAAEYAAAKDSLDSAVAEIARQNGASAMKRNYTKAKTMLISATTALNSAKAKAAEEKNKVITDAATALTNATALLAEVKGLVDKLPKTKNHEKAKLKTRVASAEQALTEAQSADSGEDYTGALDKAKTAVAKLDAIKKSLTEPKSKAAAKKGKKKHK